MLKPRFQPDGTNSDAAVRRWIDPESYDTSEQLFAASLESDLAAPHFVLQEGEAADSSIGQSNLPAPSRDQTESESPAGNSSLTNTIREQTVAEQSSSDWREEVAARVSQFRARRRPRAPHYPSLLLKFDPPPSSASISSAPQCEAPTRAESFPAETGRCAPPPLPKLDYPAPAIAVTEASARIIEFPRSFAAPQRRNDELAEPVVDTPRILDVPEPQPLPPAMGGIAIEEKEQASEERCRGFELPLQTAPLSRRMIAGAIDLAVVLLASACFLGIFLRITALAPAGLQGVELFCVAAGFAWVGYQWLLLAGSGTTPGLRTARLQLELFNGDPVPRRLRYWRVVASILSCMSLGLGYAWCMLDQDQLCWHDRITRTYLAPRSQQQNGVQ